MNIEKYYIYFHNWWGGFFDGKDAINITFFKMLLQYTNMKNYEITSDIKKANVLIEAGHPNEIIYNKKKWRFRINFIGEPVYPFHKKYDMVLTGINRIDNIVDLPISVMYIHGNNFMNRLKSRKIVNVPNEFCCFVISNPKTQERIKMFHILSKYKKVSSGGRHLNNIGNEINGCSWSSPKYLGFISRHKFMICFENTKMETYSTEKIVNAYLAGVIPIYWATDNVKKIFNEKSMIFLEDETEESYQKVIDKIIELDNNDAKYLKFVNEPIFTDDNLKYWDENYSLQSLGIKINNILHI